MIQFLRCFIFLTIYFFPHHLTLGIIIMCPKKLDFFVSICLSLYRLLPFFIVSPYVVVLIFSHFSSHNPFPSPQVFLLCSNFNALHYLFLIYIFKPIVICVCPTQFFITSSSSWLSISFMPTTFGHFSSPTSYLRKL